VLCFARAPQQWIPQARAIYLCGSSIVDALRREDVLGPLSFQISRLFQLVMEDIYGTLGFRPTDNQALLLERVIREAISNAVTHREYFSSDVVRVTVKLPYIEIVNPGAFPKDASFETLMNLDGFSAPNDAAIAWYLTTLLSHEGVGRGFSLYKQYCEHLGSDAIRCEVPQNLRSLKLRIRVPEQQHPGCGRGPSSALVHQRATPAERLSPRLCVDGRYQLGRKLGEGASSSVYVAEDSQLGRTVALKLLSKRFVSDEAQYRFAREARVLGRVDHPGVVTVFGAGYRARFLRVA